MENSMRPRASTCISFVKRCSNCVLLLVAQVCPVSMLPCSPPQCALKSPTIMVSQLVDYSYNFSVCTWCTMSSTMVPYDTCWASGLYEEVLGGIYTWHTTAESLPLCTAAATKYSRYTEAFTYHASLTSKAIPPRYYWVHRAYARHVKCGTLIGVHMYVSQSPTKSSLFMPPAVTSHM